MKIFVTGGTGFIGSHLIEQLLLEGFIVYAQRRSSIISPKIKLSLEPIWVYGEYSEINFNLLPKIDVIIHLAAHSANIPYDTLEKCIDYNVVQPLIFFERAKNHGVDRFLVAGSCFEYGKSGEYLKYIPVDAPLLPTQTYPASKAISSIAFSQFAIENNLKLSYHRIFQVFGEGELESRLWPSLKRAAFNGEDFPMTKGEQIRDFIYVKDVANHFIESLSLEIEKGIPEFMNVGSGKPQSILNFSTYWWNKWGAKGKLLVGYLPYRKGEVMRFVPKV
jgi:nucleoside-diphosphate-sugar epimerase